MRSQYHAAVLAAGMGGSAAPGSTTIHLPSSASSVASGADESRGGGGDDGLDTALQLQLLFQYYCRYGRTGRETEVETLDNAMWSKFCRDSPGLLDRRASPTELDLVFYKVKAKAARRIDYNLGGGGVWGGGGGAAHGAGVRARRQ